MSIKNEPRLVEDRMQLLQEQLQLLVRKAWLPHLVLALCCLLGMLAFGDTLRHGGVLAVGGGLVVMAALRWLTAGIFQVAAPEGYAGWRALQLISALLTGGLAATLISLLLLQVGGWQQMVLLAMLASLLVSFWLASTGCMLTFLCYVTPVVLASGLVFFYTDNTGPKYFAAFLAALLVLELLAAMRISALHASKLMLKRLLLQAREQKSQEVQELQQQLARARTREQALQLQLDSSNAHLEHRSGEQTRALRQTLDRLRTSEERLQTALEASGLALWDWDLVTGRVHHTASEKLLGVSAEQAGQLLADLRPLMHPDDRPALHAAMTAHLRQETENYRVEYRIRHAEGHWVWVEDSGRVILRNAQGRALRMLGTRRDITERRQHQEELQLASIVFDTGSEAIMVLDAQLQLLTVNRAFTRITGFARDEGQPFRDHLHHVLLASAQDEIMACLYEKGDWHGEISGIRADGSSFPVRLHLRGVQCRHGDGLSHVVAFFSDLTQFRETQQRLDYLARHDELTGLTNRNRFHQQLQDASRRLGTPPTAGLALLHIDLDRFKLLNECFGMATGDEVLRIVGRRLKRFSSPQRSLARLGGDEFVMIVYEGGSAEALGRLAEEVLAVLSAPFATAGQELLLSASIGISQARGDSLDTHGLLNRAALAVAHAKYLGGNTWQLYRDEMSADGGERLQLEQQLRRGLQEGHVHARYQPKLCLKENRIYAVEALARWNDPERGAISPARFIPLAEETGLIGKLSESILQQACRQAKDWLDAGTPLQVSVNLSVLHLRQGNVLELVARVLSETGLPAYLLELELTESQLLDGSDGLLDTIIKLRALGVEIAVDDFGTGYSSLGYLKQLPASSLKIDRSFVRDLASGTKDAAITRAIIAMAHGLSLQVVAEGVETVQQLELLRAMNCDSVQGYLIARPLSAAALEPLLQAEDPLAWALAQTESDRCELT